MIVALLALVAVLLLALAYVLAAGGRRAQRAYRLGRVHGARSVFPTPAARTGRIRLLTTPVTLIDDETAS